MTQNTIPPIVPGDANFKGADLRARLNEFSAGYNSGQSGAAVPPWAEPGFTFARIAQDGTIEPVIVLDGGQVVRIPRADRALAEMDPQQVRATIDVAPRSKLTKATGGVETNLSFTGYETRLSVQFVAIGSFASGKAGCNIAHASQMPADMMATLRLQGITTPSYVRDSAEAVGTASSAFQGAASLHVILEQDDLVSGQTYEWQLRLRKGQNVGPSNPRKQYISGVNH